MSHEKATGNNSIIEQIQKKSSKYYVEFTHQMKKVFHFVWKSRPVASRK